MLMRTIHGVAVAVGFCAIIALQATSHAAVDLTVGDKIVFFDREGSTNGGEFGIAKYNSINQTVGSELFRTFCVQVNENMAFWNSSQKKNWFNVVGISAYSVAGNTPLSPKTAFLYTEFRAGTLAGYQYLSNTTSRLNEHISDANMLQKAIWYFQQQITFSSAGGASNVYITLANNSGWTGIGDVRIANLTWGANTKGVQVGKNAQDQLILVPIPAPLAAGLSLLALVFSLPQSKRWLCGMQWSRNQ